MFAAVNANIRIYYLKSSHVVDDAYYSWAMIAQGSVSHTWKHHSSLVQLKHSTELVTTTNSPPWFSWLRIISPRVHTGVLWIESICLNWYYSPCFQQRKSMKISYIHSSYSTRQTLLTGMTVNARRVRHLSYRYSHQSRLNTTWAKLAWNINPAKIRSKLQHLST